MLTKEDFINRITTAGTLEDIVEVRTMLAELSDDVSNIFDQNAEQSKTIEDLTSDNESLRSANMKLFLRVGDNKQPDDVIETTPKEKRKFENLFNEKGEL